ncbi:MAG: 1-acyl-sn-glycerol-3-phosphate acyltransferase [Solirubrobacteraceae bacterium]
MNDADARNEARACAEGGPATELDLSDRRARLPVPAGDLRDALPGLESERRVTDWGRSERVEGLLDRTLLEFLYSYWFRVEVDGIENVPPHGGALLVANHAGVLPSDAAMVAKAIAAEHPRPRPLQIATEQTFSGVPGLGMLVTKLGAVAAHPANLHRLLFDEAQLVLVFPEGRRGPRKPLAGRYRLRRFDRVPFVECALRAQVPIVPVAVLGSEEALPTFGALGPLGRLPYLSLSCGLPLPAKFRLRFLEPVATDELGDAPWCDQGLVGEMTADIRALIQENLLELVSGRQSVWLG